MIIAETIANQKAPDTAVANLPPARFGASRVDTIALLVMIPLSPAGQQTVRTIFANPEAMQTPLPIKACCCQSIRTRVQV